MNRNRIHELAADLRAQADRFSGDQSEHVHGMYAGLRLAAVQVERLANEVEAQTVYEYKHAA